MKVSAYIFLKVKFPLYINFIALLQYIAYTVKFIMIRTMSLQKNGKNRKILNPSSYFTQKMA